MKGGTVVALTTTSACINGIAQVHDGKVLELPEFVAVNSALLLTFVGIGQFFSWDLAIALAAAYFVGTMLKYGLPFFAFVDGLIEGVT